jgi:lauroyl/myristoyl acyltransferase
MESYWFGRPREWLEALLEWNGLEELKEAQQDSRGILLFTGHVGSTGMFLTALGRNGMPVNLVFRSVEDIPGMPESWYRYGKKRIALLEKAVHRPVIWAGRSNYFSMRQKLREGETVLMGIDVVPFFVRKAVRVSFLGRTCFFPDGLARLYLDTGARLFIWFAHQNARRIHEMTIREVTAELEGLSDREPITQRLVTLLEDRIRKHPEDWLEWEALHQFFAAPEDAEL